MENRIRTQITQFRNLNNPPFEGENKTDDASLKILEFDLPKNPDEEKEKSCAKKENRNGSYAEILKSPESESGLETVAIQQNHG